MVRGAVEPGPPGGGAATVKGLAVSSGNEAHRDDEVSTGLRVKTPRRPPAHRACTSHPSGWSAPRRLSTRGSTRKARPMSVSYGVLSTYPPTPCGLATFSRSLVDALGSPEDVVGVVQLVDGPEEVTHPEVVHQWVRGSAEGAAGAAAVLDRHDVVVVQHEYGIFGGPDGADVLEVARRLSAPVVLVVHTVLVSPSPRQLHIVRELAARSAAVVTMTRTARDRLVAHYGLDVEAVTVVPHGAAPGTAVASTHRVRPAQQRPVVLTWGLLGAGKGIEWGVEALDQLRDLSPRYRVVGRTHPKVLEHEGERYRDAGRAGPSHRGGGPPRVRRPLPPAG